LIGVDTSVIVRLLVADDEKQADAASRYLKAHCSSDDPALLSDIVLSEASFNDRRPASNPAADS
jgi:predicted nucleic acid-binding protein